VFIDDVDSIFQSQSDTEDGPVRNSVKGGFKIQMGKLSDDSNRVLVMGATNWPERIDHTFYRLFQLQLLVDVPEQAGRIEIMKSALAKLNNNLTEADFHAIGVETEGLTGYNIRTIVMEAANKKFGEARYRHHFKQVNISSISSMSYRTR